MPVVEFGSLPFWGEMFEFFLTFLLIFVTVYGILWKTSFLSDRKDVNSLVAFAIGLITALSGVIPFLIRLLPYYMFFFLAVFVVFFLGNFVGMDMEKVMKSKYVIIGLISIFVLITVVVSWQLYSEETAKRLAEWQAMQENMTNQTVGINYTGNIFVDAVTVYNYQCARAGVYSQPITTSSFICILMHPRVLGALIVLISAAIISAIFVSRKQ